MNTDSQTKHKCGPKVDPRRQLYVERLGAKESTMRKHGKGFLDMLDRCADDDARRLIIKAMAPLNSVTKRTQERYKYRMGPKRKPIKKANVDRMIYLAEKTTQRA